MSNLINQSIGRYHILEQLGQGGMATVYRAFDTRLEREVALKIIRKDAFPAETHNRILKRFEREAKALSRMSHPNIVKVYESGEHNGSPYMVMELVSGNTLKEITKPMHFRQAIKLLLSIAEALEHAHLNGILHRDVKPSNILINTNGKPMLADFGIAKLLEEGEGFTLTGTGIGIGTPEYMAPEQGLGLEVDGRADIYSLGIVLFELLTGKKPYTADTPMAVIVKQINNPLPQPRMINDEIPDSVERIIYKALQKQRENRYPDMGALIIDMKRILGEACTPGASVSDHIDRTLKKEIYINVGTADSDLMTRDDYLPLNPNSPSSLPGIVSNTPLKIILPYLFVTLGGLGGIILGIVLINFGISTVKYSKIVQPETPEAIIFPALTETPAGFLNEQKLLNSITPVQVTTIITPPPSFDKDVIQISNIQTLNELHRWNVSVGYNSYISWESDSSSFFLASGGLHYSWFDIPTRSMEEFQIDMQIPSLSAFSSHSLYYNTTGSDCSQIDIWRFNSKEKLFSVKGATGYCGAEPHFSPDCQLLAAVLDDSLSFWNANNGSLITVLEEKLGLSTYAAGDLISGFSSDSRYFAAGKTKTGEIKIWDVATNSLISIIHWHEGLQSLYFSPDNTMLVSGSFSYTNKDVIRLWDVASGNLINKIQKNNEKIHSVTFSLDGQLVLSSSELGTVRAWDVPWGNLIRTISNEGDSVELVSISPNGKYLLTAGKDIVLYGIQNP